MPSKLKPRGRPPPLPWRQWGSTLPTIAPLLARNTPQSPSTLTSTMRRHERYYTKEGVNYAEVEMHVNGVLPTNDGQMKLREAFTDPKLGSVHRGVGLEIGVGVTCLLNKIGKLKHILNSLLSCNMHIAMQFAYCDRIYIASNTYTIQRTSLRCFCW